MHYEKHNIIQTLLQSNLHTVWKQMEQTADIWLSTWQLDDTHSCSSNSYRNMPSFTIAIFKSHIDFGLLSSIQGTLLLDLLHFSLIYFPHFHNLSLSSPTFSFSSVLGSSLLWCSDSMTKKANIYLFITISQINRIWDEFGVFLYNILDLFTSEYFSLSFLRNGWFLVPGLRHWLKEWEYKYY